MGASVSSRPFNIKVVLMQSPEGIGVLNPKGSAVLAQNSMSNVSFSVFNDDSSRAALKPHECVCLIIKILQDLLAENIRNPRWGKQAICSRIQYVDMISTYRVIMRPTDTGKATVNLETCTNLKTRLGEGCIQMYYVDDAEHILQLTSILKKYMAELETTTISVKPNGSFENWTIMPNFLPNEPILFAEDQLLKSLNEAKKWRKSSAISIKESPNMFSGSSPSKLKIGLDLIKKIKPYLSPETNGASPKNVGDIIEWYEKLKNIMKTMGKLLEPAEPTKKSIK